jgi:xanthine dehydrogenase accessory factor
MREQETFDFLCTCLREGRQVAWLIVVESIGSSPGRRGYKMAVCADGSMSGSIGGGIMEHKWVEWVLEKLRRNENFFELRRQIHNKDAPGNQSGMICSGEQTLLLLSVRPEHHAALHALREHTRAGKNGRLQISPDHLEYHTAEAADSWYSFHHHTDQDWNYTEITGPVERAYIVGAGHVGQEMSRLLSLLGFYVTVFDHREGLNTLDSNTWADEKIVLDYATLSGYIPESDHTWVIVMTFGYRTDEVAIRNLLGKKFRYLGVMGSRSKTDALLTALREDGYPEEWLAAMRSPAGLPIFSKTPAEIAVSIAAEMIRIKNGGEKH